MSEPAHISSPRRKYCSRQDLRHGSKEIPRKRESTFRRLFGSTELVDFLENDPASIALIDLSTCAGAKGSGLDFVLCNASLRSSNGLLDLLLQNHDTSSGILDLPSHSHDDGIIMTKHVREFQAWICRQYETKGSGAEPSHICAGLLWTASPIKEQWLILRGVVLPFTAEKSALVHTHLTEVQDSEDQKEEETPREGNVQSQEVVQPKEKDQPKEKEQFEEKHVSKLSKSMEKAQIAEGIRTKSKEGSQVASSDYGTPKPGNVMSPSRKEAGASVTTQAKTRTSHPEHGWWYIPEPLTDHQRFVRDFDWAATPLGPMGHWPTQLREMCNLVMTNQDAAAVFWGDEMTSIYNEAFVDFAGQKHPGLMGISPAVGFAEVWEPYFAAPIQKSRQSKQAFSEESLCLYLERLGFPEETFVTFTFLPLLGEDSRIVGFYHTVYEVTNQTLGQRRMTMLLKTSERTATATDLKSFWKLVIQSLD